MRLSDPESRLFIWNDPEFYDSLTKRAPICYPSHFDHLITFVHGLFQRISIPEIRNHPWFLKNLPADLMNDNMTSNQYEEPEKPMQRIDEIMHIIAEATIPAARTHGTSHCNDGGDVDDDMDDLDSDLDPDLDVDSSGEIVYAM